MYMVSFLWISEVANGENIIKDNPDVQIAKHFLQQLQ